MRRAEEFDHWDKVYKRNYANAIKYIKLRVFNNLYEITFKKGITVICGLNGAGKSTIIAAVKRILGLNLNESDRHKICSAEIEGLIEYSGEEIRCTVANDKFISDKNELDNIAFLDCDENLKIQEFNIMQTNFEELLDQNEEYELSMSELDEVSYLIGKKYQTCKIWEFEDIENIGTVPFFKVTIDGIEYDSRSMGRGEHFLFYLFWCINKYSSGTIVIIEEPETYISIRSQICFSNYLAKQIAKKGIQVVMTTHSPYFLEHIKSDNITIVSRVGNISTISMPDNNQSAEEILGIEHNYKGTLFVEDRVAHDFLSVILENKAPYILRNYYIEIAQGGEQTISEWLKLPLSDKINYDFIGVYDGDMRSRLDTSKLKHKCFFLPGDDPLEKICIEYLRDESHLNKFCGIIGKEKEQIITLLSTIDGSDYHDWFEELRKKLSIDGKTLVKYFYTIMDEMDGEVQGFVTELNKYIMGCK